MNFIIRNLGWILLIIFFVFMLYLISNQNNATNKNTEQIGTGISDVSSGSILMNSGAISGAVDSIPTELDVKENNNLDAKEEEEIENDMKNDLQGNVQKDSSKIIEMTETGAILTGSTNSQSGGMINSLRDFFTIKKTSPNIDALPDDSLSGTTHSDENLEVDETLIKVVESELEGTGVENKKIAISTFGDQLSNDSTDIESEEKNKEMMHTLSGSEKSSFFDGVKSVFGLNEKKEKEFNGKALELDMSETLEKDIIQEVISDSKNDKDVKEGEQLGGSEFKTYEVGVHSLKLNNAWFTKKLGIVYMGDTVEQLSPINKYGCFKVKVLDSKNKKNNGKVAWVCEYYMKNHQASLAKYNKEASIYNRSLYKNSSVKTKSSNSSMRKTTPIKNTVVGSLYMVNTHSLKLNNVSFNKATAYLLKGDVVEQLNNVNKNGCFKVAVVSSYNSKANNVQKRGWVCQKYLSAR